MANTTIKRQNITYEFSSFLMVRLFVYQETKIGLQRWEEVWNISRCWTVLLSSPHDVECTFWQKCLMNNVLVAEQCSPCSFKTPNYLCKSFFHLYCVLCDLIRKSIVAQPKSVSVQNATKRLKLNAMFCIRWEYLSGTALHVVQFKQWQIYSTQLFFSK